MYLLPESVSALPADTGTVAHPTRVRREQPGCSGAGQLPRVPLASCSEVQHGPARLAGSSSSEGSGTLSA